MHPSQEPRLSFHHTGIACSAISDELPVYEAIGFTQEGTPFEDHAQGVRGVFLAGNGTRIELLEALPGSTTLAPWLAAGIRMYHQAFLTDSVEATTEALRALGGIVVRRASPAPAFEGRAITFVILRGKIMLELVERETGE